jgi:hypothetical protein
MKLGSERHELDGHERKAAERHVARFRGALGEPMSVRSSGYSAGVCAMLELLQADEEGEERATLRSR